MENKNTQRGPLDLISQASFTTRTLNCHGCDNNCLVVRYDFGDGKKYFSGNRCEKIFNNGMAAAEPAENAYEIKEKLLFERAEKDNAQIEGAMTIGIPRILNMFEDFPLWFTIFKECGFNVKLSTKSAFPAFEQNARMVMSDNICFPAKLVHAHITDLQKQGVDRIFFPFTVYGPRGKEQNSYNCPIVAGYSQVVKNVQNMAVPFDCPTISMKDQKLFLAQCKKYFKSLGVKASIVEKAYQKALEAQAQFDKEIARGNQEILSRAKGLVIMLAGRPYHTDPLIQHSVSQMIAAMGATVITDDLVRDMDIKLQDINFLSQWTYTNRILKAAKWAAGQGPDVQFVEFTSFGCGPDAFLLDQIRDLLMRYGKSLTILKLDDISNVGSMKLRVRSMIDSLKLAGNINAAKVASKQPKPFITTPKYMRQDRRKTIIIPFFTPFISPLIPSLMTNFGYQVVNLPMSDQTSADFGLKFANNEVCYPATLVVGDIIKAFKEGGFNPKDTVVAMTQTGGQCRASNYLALIKKALIDAGYGDIPVLSISTSGGLGNEQPGFKVNWVKAIYYAVDAVIYSDVIAKLYYPAAVRQKPGTDAKKLMDVYLEKGAEILRRGGHRQLLYLAKEAAEAFDKITDDTTHKKVGIVGEIYLKFNPFAHKNLIEWLISKGIEVAPPILVDFFIQFFVNRKVNNKKDVSKDHYPEWIMNKLFGFVESKLESYNNVCSINRNYNPFGDIFEKAKMAEKIITLSAQFGEGWLLPGEIMSFYSEGIPNVLSLQPFGCIANHIISRGIEKKVKQVLPDINFLSIDFDSGVSEVNIINRMLLFTDNLK